VEDEFLAHKLVTYFRKFFESGCNFASDLHCAEITQLKMCTLVLETALFICATLLRS